jgi:hypothetical protein
MDRRGVLPNVMLSRLLILLSIAAALFGQKVPPANFSGTIHGVSKKHLVLETAEGNLVDFDLDGKTRVLRQKRRMQPEDLQTGDAVTIEAAEEPARNKLLLKALTITISAPPKVESRP